jgi:ABC-type transport system substrate-binding protein
VTVAPGQTATVDVPTPAAGIYSYFFNHAVDTPPFSSADVRDAFNIAIDRSAIVTDLAADPDLGFASAPEPAYSYIPTSLQESDWSVTTIADADTTGANDLLSSQSAPFSFEVLYNDGDNPHGVTADYVLADIEALNNVDVYTKQSVDFSTLISHLDNGTFELIRVGWLLVSNNLYQYFAAITDDYWIKASYDSSELDTLLADMKSALDSGDLDTYEQKILAVNELLITDAVGMPVYEY